MAEIDPEERRRLLDEVHYARNGYASAVSAAEGFVSGKRVYALKHEEKRLRDALWAARDLLADPDAVVATTREACSREVAHMARGYVAHLMQPLLDAAEELRKRVKTLDPMGPFSDRDNWFPRKRRIEE